MENFELKAKLVEQYMTAPAPKAAIAMEELLSRTDSYRTQGATGIDFEQQYASTHSRLYLVRSAIGEHATAATHHAKATEYWKRVYAKGGFPDRSERAIESQIAEVDVHLGTPVWLHGTRKP